MKETLDQLKKRTRVIIKKLKVYYPDARCALEHQNPLQLLVATILSAQCTDARVNIVTRELFKKYKSAKDFADADLSVLEEQIKPTGFFRAKAKSLKGMGEQLVTEHGGQVPGDGEALVKLPGVGRKTANVVLGDAFGITNGIVVDTHVKRLSFRLGLTKALMPEKVEIDLQKIVPREEWVMFSHRLIFHGRQLCKARKPQCNVCPLEGVCPKKGVKLR